MASIDRIVNVSIALSTTGVQQQTFSDLLLLAPYGATNDPRVQIITEADQLLSAPFTGITDTSDVYRAAQVAFSQIPGPNRLFIGRRNTGEAAATALAAIKAANNDWYGFSDVTHTEADLGTIAAWAEANEKLFLTTISDVDVTASSGTEPATALMTGNFFRTAWWYNPDPDQFPEVAAAARMFTILPGGETWALKRLSGVTATPLLEGAAVNVFAKNGNTFEPFTGTSSITQNGKVAGGEWIDTIRFRDWLCQEIRDRVFVAMVNLDKVPYTDAGIAVIGQAMTAALDLGVRRGGIAPPMQDADNPNRIIPSFTVSLPRRSQVSQVDVAARILRDVKFTARLAGAIHAVQINGSLTYDNIG